MDYETFETKVAQRAGVPGERARALIRASLLTLGERLTRGEAHDLASQLPEPAKEWVVSPTPEAERFGLDEFVRRVAQRSGATPEEAEAGVRAVFSVLRLAVTTGEFRDAMSQLPKEFSELVKQP
ncbi:MAG: hypothetical protein JWL68_6005 [Actinomycetia bacterium]|nr:hypothetical protein [Actinomycetes bacterium]MDX6333652.1 hypothetical protein [Streptosporangiaceae bacterium]